MVSFIISVDTTYEMADNFFELFFSHKFVKQSEIVVVVDGNYNLQIHHLLNKLQKEHLNLKVIYSSKIGYGKANNLGVKHSTGEYLFFINTDIFIEDGCFEKMLAVLNGGIADCVHPLLIYPQSNLVQCAGTFFGPYFKDHLFDGNRIDADIVNQDGPRQALTSALYAMKRSVFDELNGFDEFYYNKLEGFELSYKIYLSGKTCWYLSSARAWHSRGGGRNLYSFDFKQQESYFWSRFGDTVKPDISEYLNKQINQHMKENSYYTIIMSQLRSWKEIISNTEITSSTYVEMPWVGPEGFNLWNIFPSILLKTPEPLLLIIENIKYLRSNKYWLQVRNHPDDLAIDRYANLVNIQEYLS